MSIAATLGTMGLAMKTIDDDARKARSEEQIAALRGQQIKLGELNFAQLADKAAQEKTQRERLRAYNGVATSSKDEEDFLTRKIDMAKQLGDGDTMLATRAQLLKYKTDKTANAVRNAIGPLITRGDPSQLAKVYNELIPDGNKVAYTVNPDGKFDVTFSGPDGKVVGSPLKGLDVNDLGAMAMQIVDPKFLEKTLEKDIDHRFKFKYEEQKANNQQARDLAKIGAQSAADEKMAGVKHGFTVQEIAARGIEDRKNSAASAAATGAQQRQTYTWKAVTDAAMDGGGGSDNKELDRRVKQGRAALDKYFGISQFTGLDQNSQPQYLDALDSMNRDIRAGVDPEEAAVKAARNVRAATEAAKKTGGAKPASAYPVPDYTRGR